MPDINSLNWYLNLNKPNKPTVDPCAVAKEIQKILNDASIIQKNNKLRQKENYEYSFNYKQNLNNNSNITSNIHTDNNTSSVTMSWEAYNSANKILYLGGAHNHPLNSGPSLTDLYTFNGYYNSLPHDIRKIFIQKHFQIIISKDKTYIVSIKDESTWNAEAIKYNRGRDAQLNNINSGHKNNYLEKLEKWKYFKKIFMTQNTCL